MKGEASGVSDSFQEDQLHQSLYSICSIVLNLNIMYLSTSDSLPGGSHSPCLSDRGRLPFLRDISFLSTKTLVLHGQASMAPISLRAVDGFLCSIHTSNSLSRFRKALFSSGLSSAIFEALNMNLLRGSLRIRV